VYEKGAAGVFKESQLKAGNKASAVYRSITNPVCDVRYKGLNWGMLIESPD
jgi:hypothetical protein